ncbi:CBD9-like protein [Phialemonium atrogriseum]|uniref:CBD9-like protein n=1 Tax=Phialemonium atrogriseum TaxID=1093897 RepID=A0AAJ0C0Z1_9PEZI|nr:CBD9-like protein [Phialemonium atrogriseum]KAK1767896.1 CBD9-like protein [Phialemonium atrogriseum]
MRWSRGAARAAALVGLTRRQVPPADSTVVVDAETGFTFGQFITDNGIEYRIALPDPIPANTPYDVVLQVAAPHEIGWAGISWGGSMTYSPLTVAWPNDKDVTVSSRYAFGYYVPPPFDGATYTLLPKGTHVNDTHWQYTVKCSGCTTWGDEDTGYTTLDATQQNALAFAYSVTPPEDPASNISSFSIHDSIGHWYHDFGNIGNAEFDELVSKNSEGGSTGTTPPSTPTTTATTTGTASTTVTPTPTGVEESCES